MIVLHPDQRRSDAAVRTADEVVPLPDDGALADALAAARADALWPGWHSAAEDPTTAETCERLGVTFVGPDADTLRRVRDRIAVKRLAESSGVPVVRWNGGALGGPESAVAAAEVLGFPVMLKAAAGGGPDGIRRVDERG